MFNENLISNPSFNSELNYETAILIYKLNNAFYRLEFECMEFTPVKCLSDSIHNCCFDINIILFVNSLNFTPSEVATINQICSDWYNYIHNYIEYKYFISKFKEDYEYYNNIYNWKVNILFSTNANEYLSVFNWNLSSSSSCKVDYH